MKLVKIPPSKNVPENGKNQKKIPFVMNIEFVIK